MNKLKLNEQKQLKAHIHPNSSLKRANLKKWKNNLGPRIEKSWNLESKCSKENNQIIISPNDKEEQKREVSSDEVIILPELPKPFLVKSCKIEKQQEKNNWINLEKIKGHKVVEAPPKIANKNQGFLAKNGRGQNVNIIEITDEGKEIIHKELLHIIDDAPSENQHFYISTKKQSSYSLDVKRQFFTKDLRAKLGNREKLKSQDIYHQTNTQKKKKEDDDVIIINNFGN